MHAHKFSTENIQNVSRTERASLIGTTLKLRAVSCLQSARRLKIGTGIPSLGCAPSTVPILNRSGEKTTFAGSTSPKDSLSPASRSHRDTSANTQAQSHRRRTHVQVFAFAQLSARRSFIVLSVQSTHSLVSNQLPCSAADVQTALFLFSAHSFACRAAKKRASETQRLSSTIGQAFFCLQTRPQPVAPYASGGVLSFHTPGAPEDIRERLARLLNLPTDMMTDPNMIEAAKESLHQRDDSASDNDAAETTDAFHDEDDDSQRLTVQSLPYVKCRESVSAVFSFDSAARRRISLTSNTTSDTANSSPEHADKFPTSLSYSVPSTTLVTNTPRGRPAVDVIATYMNTCDQRTVKSELMRAHAHFASPRGGPPSRIRSSSIMSKEGSAEWGWFADIDSSSESWGGDGSVHSLRRRLSADLGLIDVGNVHVLGDEQTNTRITAAHKTFTIVTEGNSKVVSATVSIPKFRIVQSRSGADRHAQYLITLMLGKELYADWRRYSEFGELVKTLDEQRYTRTQDAWARIETRWFNRLEPSYLHQKCITLENFMRELMYESNEPTVLINFLGGYMGKVNARPTDPVAYRPAAQLPKELRPPQPRHERELFEKMWAENFKRSHVDYSGTVPATQTAS